MRADEGILKSKLRRVVVMSAGFHTSRKGDPPHLGSRNDQVLLNDGVQNVTEGRRPSSKQMLDYASKLKPKTAF